jgi:hypothetical protein
MKKEKRFKTRLNEKARARLRTGSAHKSKKDYSRKKGKQSLSQERSFIHERSFSLFLH